MSGPGAAKTILLFHIISARPSKQTQKIPHGFGWRIHCGVEVTESSTNKKHSLSDDDVSSSTTHTLSTTVR
jgi:hypothetical protein